MSSDWGDKKGTPKNITPKGSTPPPSKRDSKGGHSSKGGKH